MTFLGAGETSGLIAALALSVTLEGLMLAPRRADKPAMLIAAAVVMVAGVGGARRAGHDEQQAGDDRESEHIISFST